MNIMLVIIALNVNACLGNMVLMAANADPNFVYGSGKFKSGERARTFLRFVVGYFFIQLWPLLLVSHIAWKRP